MLARLQQLLVFTLVAASIVSASFFVIHGRPGWAVFSAALILLSYALLLCIELAMLHAVQEADSTVSRASLPRLFVAWMGEVITVPQVFFWRQPFRADVEPDHLPYQSTVPRGVVLVHGYVCNRALWNPWMS